MTKLIHELVEICPLCSLDGCKEGVESKKVECDKNCKASDGIHIRVLSMHECKCQHKVKHPADLLQGPVDCNNCSCKKGGECKGKVCLNKTAFTALSVSAAVGVAAIAYKVIKEVNKEEAWIDELE